ncbi:hypothetical protein KCP77_01480 [Salmonella enterica subsp. enterica]|nr:hypothetical protein KCP77_01480 [Salmonella enterica subsp. enterica]
MIQTTDAANQSDCRRSRRIPPAQAALKPVIQWISRALGYLALRGVAVKRIGDETFRPVREHLDDIITVDSDAICGDERSLFEDVRWWRSPPARWRWRGMKKYRPAQWPRQRLAHVLFRRQRQLHTACATASILNALRAGDGATLLAVTFRKKGGFLKFASCLAGVWSLNLTPFCGAKKYACIFT